MHNQTNIKPQSWGCNETILGKLQEKGEIYQNTITTT